MVIEQKFHNKNLLDAVTASHSELESFQRRLDEATADTRELEVWLQSTGFCIDVFIPVETEAYHEIGWSQIGGKWRVVGAYWEDQCEGPSYRALTESNARARLACQQYLPRLVNEITKIYTSLKEPVSTKVPSFSDSDFQ